MRKVEYIAKVRIGGWRWKGKSRNERKMGF
jgi:hypothetical protein